MYEFLEDYTKLEIQKIEEIEKKLKITLPDDYKTFISEYNNSDFKSGYYFARKKGRGYLNSNKRQHLYDEFLGLYKFYNFEEIEVEISFAKSIMRNFNKRVIIPIIQDDYSNRFFLYVKKDKYYGRIYYADHDSDHSFETLYYMADNLKVFFKCIIDDATYRKMDIKPVGI